MRSAWYAVVAGLGVLLGLFSAEIAGGFGGHADVRYVDDLVTIAAALLATVFCLRAGVRNTGRLRTFWCLFAIAAALWCLGEILWATYELILKESVPTPSWADAGYLAAIPFAVAALSAHPAMHGRTTRKARAILDGLMVAAALFYVAWTLLLEPLWRSTDLTSAGGLVTLAYPASDVLFLFLIVLVIRGTTDGDRLDLWFLLAGLLAMTLSDAVYGYLTEVAGYATGNLIDIGWVAGYLAVAAGAYAARPQRAVGPAHEPRALTRAALVTPFLPVLAGLGLMAVRMELGRRLDRVGWTTALLLVTAVLVRQVLLALDLYAGAERDGELSSQLLSSVGAPLGDGVRLSSNRKRPA